VRAAAAAGAEGLELDPKTGVYRVVLPGKGARADRNPWDEVLNNAADQKRPA
jgi:hypothetical protein